MEGSAIRTTYVEGGTYAGLGTLNLSAADTGFTFAAAMGQKPVLAARDGVQTLVSLNGAARVTLTGLTFSNAGTGAVSLTGASGNTITGNLFQSNAAAIVLNGSSNNVLAGNAIDQSGRFGIEVKDASNGNTIDSNIINGTSTPGMQGGAVNVHGANFNVITHNLVQNTAGVGIALENFDDFATINVGNTIAYNVVRNTGAGTAYDSGSIYVLGRARVDTKTAIHDNLVDGTGPGGDAHDVGIYLDDGASGVAIYNNIVRNTGTHSVQIHSGHSNDIQNNIFDLGTGTNSAVFIQAENGSSSAADAMYGNAIHGNVLTTSNPGQGLYESYNGGALSIYGNLYWNYVGGALQMNPNATDTAPKYGDPRFANPAAGNYAVLPGSATAQIGYSPVNQAEMGLAPTTAHWYA